MSEAPSLPRVFGAVILPAFASIASIGFGLIEGEIRPVDSLLQWSSGTAMVIAQTDGDRKIWRYLLPWMFCYLQAQPLGQLFEGLASSGEQQKFLATPADQGIFFPQQRLAECDQPDQHLIANFVTKAVVDLFEVIAIKHDNPDFTGFGSQMKTLEFVEIVAIVGASQGIVTG